MRYRISYLRTRISPSIVSFGIAVVFWCLSTPTVQADFYTRVDRDGTRHISNVPPNGFDNNGDIRRAYDPNSIVYQHRNMLDALAAQGEEIARKAENSRARSALPESVVRPPVLVGRGPREGVMNLDELIELEKRGGRYERTSPTDP